VPQIYQLILNSVQHSVCMICACWADLQGVCSRGWLPVSDANPQYVFLKKCSLEVCYLQFSNSVLLQDSLCGTVTVLRSSNQKNRPQAVPKHVPLGLLAEGTGPLQALCKSHVRKFHVTTHPPGQRCIRDATGTASICHKAQSESCTRAVVAAYKPKLLPHHF